MDLYVITRTELQRINGAAYLWCEYLINNNNMRGVGIVVKCVTCIIKQLQKSAHWFAEVETAVFIFPKPNRICMYITSATNADKQQQFQKYSVHVSPNPNAKHTLDKGFQMWI